MSTGPHHAAARHVYVHMITIENNLLFFLNCVAHKVGVTLFHLGPLKLVSWLSLDNLLLQLKLTLCIKLLYLLFKWTIVNRCLQRHSGYPTAAISHVI
jgi:hypothetical protein